MENYLCLVLNCFLLRCEIDVFGGKIGDKSVSAGPQSESYLGAILDLKINNSKYAQIFSSIKVEMQHALCSNAL